MVRLGKKSFGFGLCIWALLVVVGTARMARFSATPGMAAVAPQGWPAKLPFKPAERGLTLVLALHPKCSCSRATLGELAQLMTRDAGGVRAYVLMVRPSGEPDGWERGELWDTAAAIPYVTVLSDPDGRLSAKLGAKTSGQTYAFDSQGKLQFSGGITPVRGHMGESVGGDAVDNLLVGEKPKQVCSPVFGCPLNDSAGGDAERNGQ